jgi:hypothetical protein
MKQKRSGKNKNHTKKRLFSYAAAAGVGAFSFGQTGEAAIMYTDVVPDTTVSTPGSGSDVLYINLDNAGYNEFALAALAFDRSIRVNPYNVIPQASEVLTSGSYYVVGFAPGALIGPASAAAGGARFALRSPYVGAYYNFLGTGLYTGLKWDIGGGNFLYGWAAIDVTAQAGVGSSATLLSYAYETTPDTPIEAGAVPEPDTLALLAAGFGALAMRRRGS